VKPSAARGRKLFFGIPSAGDCARNQCEAWKAADGIDFTRSRRDRGSSPKTFRAWTPGGHSAWRKCMADAWTKLEISQKLGEGVVW